MIGWNARGRSLYRNGCYLGTRRGHWKQKLRITWLKEGERNTKFFHLSTLIRRRRNRVDRLKLDGAQWCSDPDLQKSRAREFYAHLYTAEPCLPCDSQDWNFPTLCHRDRSWLNRPVVAQEIYEAISQMGAYKAPGPDGFPPCLFQIYWHILGDKVTEAVQNIFFRGKLIDDLNNVLICLIPKCKVPESFSQFRPISLYVMCW